MYYASSETVYSCFSVAFSFPLYPRHSSVADWEIVGNSNVVHYPTIDTRRLAMLAIENKILI